MKHGKCRKSKTVFMNRQLTIAIMLKNGMISLPDQIFPGANKPFQIKQKLKELG